MARDTVSNPREGAETVLALGLPRQALWLAFALVVVLSMLLGDIREVFEARGADRLPSQRIVDDLIVYRFNKKKYMMIVNASKI